MTVPFNVQITSIDDIDLGDGLSTSGDLDGESEICIYSNGSSGYTVKASSANGSGSFVMQRALCITKEPEPLALDALTVYPELPLE